MKTKIVADGPARLSKGRYDRDVAAGHAKHSEYWKKAGWIKRIWLYLTIRHSARKPNPNDHQPSPGSLY
jgi:hypothetical protein